MSNNDIPDAIKPMIAHGLDVKMRSGKEWIGHCPYCGKRDHFYVNAETGTFDCKVCGQTGNAITFLTHAAEDYAASISRKRRRKLSASRGVPTSVIRNVGIGYDDRTSTYTIPVKSGTGFVRDIRRYSIVDGKLKSTMGCETQLFGADRLANASSSVRVWLCEGEWDAIAMQWILNEAGLDDVAVGVPGASTFKKKWPRLFSGKDVVAAYDNDAAGDKGAVKAKDKLIDVVRSIKFVHWPDGKKSGYDLRDFVNEGMADHGDAERIVNELLEVANDKPRRGTSSSASSSSDDADDDGQYRPELPPLVDIELDEVIAAFRDTIYMTDEMEMILKVMLATALSNDVKSDPIWLYIVGPPGAGKTLLLSAFQGSTRCVFRSTLTPASLVSGWKSEGGRDPSLIPKLNGKTLVAKDFTEILDMPSNAQDEIFSTLRGAFDGHVQRSFGNGVNREYHDCHFSILAGVTHAIHGHKKAHLGERFLRLEMTNMRQDHMDQVLDAAIGSIGTEHDTEIKLQHAVASYLQKTVDRPPPIDPEVRKSIGSLVKLIAQMRSQVSRDPRTGEVSYRPKAELGTRLAKQLAKLGSMLAFVLGQPTVNEEIYDVLLRVAFDTVGGYSLDIVKAMMEMGGRGTRGDVAELIDASSATLYRRFEDLLLIGIIEKEPKTADSSPRGGRPAVVYKVRSNVMKLWETAKGKDTWDTTTQSKSSMRKSERRSARRSAGSQSRSRKAAKAAASTKKRSRKR